MSEQNQTESAILQGLANLEGLLKGQITTGPGSSKGNLTDMHPETYGDTWDDGIGKDGTDYRGRGRKARKGQGDDEEEGGDMPYARRDARDDEEEDEEKALPKSGEDNARMSSTMKYSGEATSKGVGGGKARAAASQRGAVAALRQAGTSFGGGPVTKAGTCKAHGKGGCPKNCPNYSPGGKGEDMSKMAPGIRPSVGMGKSQEYDDQEEGGEVRKGVEVSDFLFYLNKSIRDTFDDMEDRMMARMESHHAERGEFAKALAEGVTGIHGELCKSEGVVEEEENAPAYEAKSIMKSADEGQGPNSMKKSLDDARVQRQSILDEMFGLLEKGQVNPLDVTKFEMHGTLSPELAKSLNCVDA